MHARVWGGTPAHVTHSILEGAHARHGDQGAGDCPLILWNLLKHFRECREHASSALNSRTEEDYKHDLKNRILLKTLSLETLTFDFEVSNQINPA